MVTFASLETLQLLGRQVFDHLGHYGGGEVQVFGSFSHCVLPVFYYIFARKYVDMFVLVEALCRNIWFG